MRRIKKSEPSGSLFFVFLDYSHCAMYGIDLIPRTVLLDREGSVIAIGLRANMLSETIKIIRQAG